MALSAQVLDDITAVHALKAEWAELAGRASAYSAALGFDYATLAWDALFKRPGDRLAVVAVRDAGRLVGLWPLHVRQEPRKRVAKHLGNGSDEEYAAPLVEAGPDEAAISTRLLAEARRLGDLLILRNLPVPGVMADAVIKAGGLQYRWDDACSVIGLAGVGSFEAWVAPKSKQFRYDLRNERRKLAALGRLESRAMAGPVDGPRFADWLFEAKRAWATERGMSESWLHDDQGRDHLAALLAGSPDAFGQAILLDDKIIAGGSVVVSRDRLEFFVTVFDPAFAGYRPGNLLNEDLARRAIEMGLDLDFRMMLAGYKDRWADRKEPIASFWLANSLKGAAAVLAQRVRVKLRRG
jgi:CelD/BcsL family acetyltransferase involved in cellulose biosynthesis